jgi:hypothetical protein
VDFLVAEGDFKGAAVWRRILGAIKELQRAREPDEAVNFAASALMIIRPSRISSIPPFRKSA